MVPHAYIQEGNRLTNLDGFTCANFQKRPQSWGEAGNESLRDLRRTKAKLFCQNPFLVIFTANRCIWLYTRADGQSGHRRRDGVGYRTDISITFLQSCRIPQFLLYVISHFFVQIWWVLTFFSQEDYSNELRVNTLIFYIHFMTKLY